MIDCKCPSHKALTSDTVPKLLCPMSVIINEFSVEVTEE